MQFDSNIRDHVYENSRCTGTGLGPVPRQGEGPESIVNARKQNLGQGNGFTMFFCPQGGGGGLCMMSLPVRLSGPMFLPAGSGVSVKGGLCEGSDC